MRKYRMTAAVLLSAGMLILTGCVESSVPAFEPTAHHTNPVWNESTAAETETAAEAQSVLHFSGQIPAAGIRSDDLCTIFSNLLDNAVEACRAQNGRQDIFVEAKTSAGTFLLSVSNPTGAAANITRKTTKADKRNHGFGLKNVERAAKKYGGTLQTDIQNGMFCADVLLKLPKTAQATE